MGNASTKESRVGPDGQPIDSGARDNYDDSSRSRNRRSRHDLSLLGISNTSSRHRNRDDGTFQHRETRQERDARRLEREREARAKERALSHAQEHVDGGYLVTVGTYTGTEDFDKALVRQLQVERRLAPYWRGLQDWSSSWTEHQLVAAARGLPIPAADATPDPDLMPRPLSSGRNINNLTVPIGDRTLSAASDQSASGISALPSPISPTPGKTFKPAAKALASALRPRSRNSSSTDLTPKEVSLPYDPFVNGQPLEVALYKDTLECPICFLSFPPYLNHTRCCDQPICSECFVQIKRATRRVDELAQPSGQTSPSSAAWVSEPAACPYCQQPEFGVTYEHPPFRRGLSLSSASQSPASATLSPSPAAQPGRRRTQSLSANAPNVITIDRIRPDWAARLAEKNAHLARRDAAATALHHAAFVVGASSSTGQSRFSPLPRRSEPRAEPNNNSGDLLPAEGIPSNPSGGARTRMEELEEMMYQEAVRLSLASEEDRRRKEDKAIRKETKARAKEEKKALKKQGRDPYGGNASGASSSSLSLRLGRRRGNSAASNLRMEAAVHSASQAPSTPEREDAEAAMGKGKGVDRGLQNSASEGNSSAGSLPIPTGSGRTGSHLRQMSNTSSLGSSFADTPAGSFSAGGYAGPEGGDNRGSSSGAADDEGERDTGSEPMFNFRSLAEMVGVDIDGGQAHRQEGDEGNASTGPLQPRPLSQVKEDDYEEAEAEHLEVPDGSRTEEKKVSTPELTVTPETPAVEGARAELKQLGEPNVQEQPSQSA
jgi:hypothetical protein